MRWRFHKFKRQIVGRLWLPGLMTLLLLLPIGLNHIIALSGRSWERFFQPMSGTIAPLFTPPVQYWGAEIGQWAQQYGIDPNLMATVMQIESCGHPTVISSAGAQGLFQVMPFHFASSEVMTDPATNARRSANFLNECTRYARGDAGLTLACYNGGPSVVNKSFHTWAAETQRYYVWGVAIYADATQHNQSSVALEAWLEAGGMHLCRRASDTLGIR